MKSMALRMLAAMALLAGCVTVSASRAVADEYVEATPATRLAHGLNPANWQMPKWKLPDVRSLLPGNEEKARIKKKKEGFLDEVSKTASNSWNKTKAVFSPDNFTPMRIFPASSRTPVTKETQAKPGFFRSLLSPWPAEPESQDTISEFLGQPRP